METYLLSRNIPVERGFKVVVAGRCVSIDVRVHGSIRVQPACSMMGQAAGVAVEQSIRTGQEAGSLDTAELVKTLRNQGAHLPQKELCSSLSKV